MVKKLNGDIGARSIKMGGRIRKKGKWEEIAKDFLKKPNRNQLL